MKGEAHQNAPRRPACPTRPRRVRTRTHTRDQAWRPPIQKGWCGRPHKTAPVHRPSPPSKDGRYVKRDASVTGSAHGKTTAAHAAQDRRRRDRPGTTPSRGWNGYDAERALRCCLGSGLRQTQGARFSAGLHVPPQPPRRSGGVSPRDQERHHGVGIADWSTESNQTGRGAAH